MIQIRASAAARASSQLKTLPRPAGGSNRDWLAKAIGGHTAAGTIVLMGGVSLVQFRLRVAQSQARNDLLPSFWSHAALIRRLRGDRDWDLWEVSLEPSSGFAQMPLSNGVQRGRFAAYDDPKRFPNVAWLEVPAADGQGGDIASKLEQAVVTFRRQRSAVDLAPMMVDWLGFAWGVRDRTNPLLRNVGIPAAVFLQSVFAIAGIELAPGLGNQSCCPEAIWQAAKWWHEFFASPAALTGGPLRGKYWVGQAEAAQLGEP
jgi:hypothetical protein